MSNYDHLIITNPKPRACGTNKIKRPKSAFGPFFQSNESINTQTSQKSLSTNNSFQSNINILKYLS